MTIKITKENKKKIFELISAFLEDETETVNKISQAQKQISVNNYLDAPAPIENLPNGLVHKYGTNEDTRINLVGTWGQFNSFFPIKAALRILGNILVDQNEKYIKLDFFIEKCIEVFLKTKIAGKKLGKFRGFPRRRKDSAVGRFVWHFLTPAFEMGLISIKSENSRINMIPTSPKDWNKVLISLTKEGYELALLPNNLFDNLNKDQRLTEEETKWIINYLKKIKNEGFNEYSILHGVYSELLSTNNIEKVWSWFENNPIFIEYIKGWTTKQNDEKAFQKQIDNLSKTFTSSKIALLRELKIIQDRRGDYSVIGELNA